MRSRIKKRERKRRVFTLAAVVVVIVLVVVSAYYLLQPTYLDAYDGRAVGSFSGNSLSTLKQAATAPYGSGGSDLVRSIRNLTGGSILASHGKPVFLYFGEDGCPYCAITRWSMVLALMRFGDFSSLNYAASFIQLPNNVLT